MSGGTPSTLGRLIYWNSTEQFDKKKRATASFGLARLVEEFAEF